MLSHNCYSVFFFLKLNAIGNCKQTSVIWVCHSNCVATVYLTKLYLYIVFQDHYIFVETINLNRNYDSIWVHCRLKTHSLVIPTAKINLGTIYSCWLKNERLWSIPILRSINKIGASIVSCEPLIIGNYLLSNFETARREETEDFSPTFFPVEEEEEEETEYFLLTFFPFEEDEKKEDGNIGNFTKFLY